MVLPCTCQHAAQDQFHGKGNRVHNWAKKNGGWRCTVCKSVKPATAEQKKANA
jgi:hypothetical protein